MSMPCLPWLASGSAVSMRLSIWLVTTVQGPVWVARSLVMQITMVMLFMLCTGQVSASAGVARVHTSLRSRVQA